MKGDFSRFTFKPNHHYTGVLMQQGRVQLDADWNEQVEINNHQQHLRTQDIIGYCGMPAHAPGFEIIVRQGVRFNGTDNFIYGGKETDLSFTHKNAFTIEAWVNPQPGEKGGVIAGRYAMFQHLNLPEYVFFINPDQTLSFFWVELKSEETYESVDMLQSEIAVIYRQVEIKSISLQIREIRTTRHVPFGTYTHVAVTLREGEINLYIDGNWAAKSACGQFQPNREGMFFIGTGWYNKRLYHIFNGVIDRMTIWDVGHGAEQIKQNLYRFQTGKEPGIIRLWRFNKEESENMNIKDWSPYNKQCVLGGGRQENAPQWEPPFIWIGKGRCYLNGILCDNPKDITYAQQPDTPGIVAPQVLHPEEVILFYLEVWQRHITAMEEPYIRETALGGPDTTTRTQTVWQVNYIPQQEAQEFLSYWEHKGQLKVRRQQTKSIRENRLYRIEIHSSGGMPDTPLSQLGFPVLVIDQVLPEHNRVTLKAWHGDQFAWEPGQFVEIFGLNKHSQPLKTITMITGINHFKKQLTLNAINPELIGALGLRMRRIASFKWSRENGAILFPIAHIEGNTLILHDPMESYNALNIGSWLELTDNHYQLQKKTAPLVQINKIEPSPEGDVILTLNQTPSYKISADDNIHPYARLWDQSGNTVQTDGGVILVNQNQWYDLDEGIQICFEGGGEYHSGDYWWVPARSNTQTIEWPEENQLPLAQPPHGITHDFAPLAKVEIKSNMMRVLEDKRHIFEPLITGIINK